MGGLAEKLNLSNKELLGIIVFVLILGTIPVAFALVKSSQILNSNASTTPKASPTPVTKAHEVPNTSPLSGLATPPPSPTPDIAVTFGPTLSFKIAMEGRAANDEAGKVFIGIGAGQPTTRPTYVLSFTVNVPSSGSFQGLSLAGLNLNSGYTAYIKGPSQIDVAIPFTMVPTNNVLNNNQPINLLSGDLNEDNVINSADYTIARNAYGSTKSSSKWDPLADFNNDGVINNLDLAFIIKNFGKTGASGAWYSSPPPVATSSATPATSSGGTSGVGGYWMWVP